MKLDYDELINAAMDVGHLLLYNGAEIYRVEESIQRIFNAYGIKSGQVFAIPTCIFVTITTEDGKPLTQIRRLTARETNLDKVERANALCRRVCELHPDFASIREEVQQIDRRPVYGFYTQVAAFALVAFSFTLFWGGNFADACCAILCGAVVKCLTEVLKRVEVNAFFINITASFAAAAIALFMVHIGLGVNQDKIIIGAMMNLVPGIVITTFMRDIMAGDLVAGLVRFMESVLVAAAIALGTGLALMLAQLLVGVM